MTRPLDRQVVTRSEIIRKAMAFVDQHDHEYLGVGDLAIAAGISERTLRRALQDYFSIGPVRYLKLRTLHQVRGALKVADPSVTSVTKIAVQSGVWEFGRFARDYRFLFGELPSETLRHR
jgi:AraC family transcriptional regulator, ethanolamine operon transcriptional activator